MINKTDKEENRYGSSGEKCHARSHFKGLEFDMVIVPYVTDRNYKTEPDRQMLYVVFTRAMHKLVLTHTGNITLLIN